MELFTSEGCSGCPQADELIGRIEKESENRRLYVMAYHVDYWDGQGWKDRFSDHAFSLRQQMYAAGMGLSGVYTPQLIINGTSQYIGSDEHAVVGEIACALKRNVTGD
ncbi:DUF1223 domain-containing protein [Chitinophaga rhizophila]|uniref:DUF1223 domain-containing protein n=1 Tax=Chitinophaga rhizophila TaxID=2866212 RepID=A0ABS7GKJ7_9BACT|nr:DUF1223 domain-containing protein [Chitinophaga rhizophila]MBW8688257.1 DUF1223 domain-containing protein [Chitinophaga rhizophila]